MNGIFAPAESRPSSATHSAPNGAAFVSANSAAPFPCVNNVDAKLFMHISY